MVKIRYLIDGKEKRKVEENAILSEMSRIQEPKLKTTNSPVLFEIA